MPRLPSQASIVLGVFALPLAGACQPTSDEGQACFRDHECQDLCSNIGECVSAETALEVRVRWSFNGVAPSPADPSVCGLVEDFEVRFDSESGREDPVSYFPVPCELGQVYYNRMPARMTTLHLIAMDANQEVVSAETRSLDQQLNELTIDFSL